MSIVKSASTVELKSQTTTTMDFTDDEDNNSSESGSGSGSDLLDTTTTANNILPANAPVQTKYRRRDVDPANRLTPGSHLQACNGTDIHLVRGAAAPSSSVAVMPPPKHGKPAKTKHRYLIVWPGIVSLNPHRAAATTAANAAVANNDNNTMGREDTKEEEEEEEETKDNSNDNNTSDNDIDVDEEEEEDKKSAKSGTAATNNTSVVASNSGTATTSLGTLEGLDTDNPTLKIPFPSGVMTFAGRKIQSSSKYMLLTCSKKGTVTCKVSRGENYIQILCVIVLSLLYVVHYHHFLATLLTTKTKSNHLV